MRSGKPKPPPAPKPPRPNPIADNLDNVILLLVAGMPLELIGQNLNLDASTLAAVIDAARKKITLAADYVRDEEIVIAIKRVNDIYSRTLRIQDMKTALAAQRELNKLLGLYAATEGPDPETGEDAAATTEQLEQIRGHLLPLALAPEDYPLAEHARIAAERIREADPPPPEKKPWKARAKGRKGSQ